MTSSRRDVVLYMPYLPVGGAERMLVRLAEGLAARGRPVSFLLDRMDGDMLPRLPRGVGVEALDAPRSAAAVPRLTAWLRRREPEVLLSALSHQNIVALVARWLARARTRVVVSEHTILSRQTAESGTWQHRLMPLLARRLYPLADARVAVSAAALEDLAAITGLPHRRFDLIHNPVVADEVLAGDLGAAVDDQWLCDDGPPVIVAAGRLVPLKDFATLLRAVAFLRAERPVRLLLLGEGPARGDLERLRDELCLQDSVRLIGAVSDPLPYFRRAAAVALTSHYEGFGVVLVEAMACGTPVISTDCPGGPAEILENGRLGPLVPVGDAEALAHGLARILDDPIAPEALRRRAFDFAASRSVEAYDALFDRLSGTA